MSHLLLIPLGAGHLDCSARVIITLSKSRSKPHYQMMPPSPPTSTPQTPHNPHPIPPNKSPILPTLWSPRSLITSSKSGNNSAKLQYREKPPVWRWASQLSLFSLRSPGFKWRSPHGGRRPSKTAGLFLRRAQLVAAARWTRCERHQVGGSGRSPRGEELGRKPELESSSRFAGREKKLRPTFKVCLKTAHKKPLSPFYPSALIRTQPLWCLSRNWKINAFHPK